MSLRPDPITLLLAGLVALILMGIVAYAIVITVKARGEKRKLAAITDALIDYFRKTGLEVSAGCTILAGSQYFTAVIETEPMKRFRLSHIIEIALRDHVRKACGLELGKVFWRFPIKDTSVAVAMGAPVTLAPAGNTNTKPPEKTDEYINEGLEQYKYIPKVEVTELSWEQFAEASTTEPHPNGSTIAPSTETRATAPGNESAVEETQTGN